MNPEKNESPFAALSFEEQQRRWMEWRSRQLDYRPAQAQAADAPRENPPPRSGLRLPNMPIAAPTRHSELDQVLSRHRQAAKRAGAYQPTKRSE